MSTYTFEQARAIGGEAARQLLNFAAIRYFEAAPRVRHWQDTLTQAFAWQVLDRGGDAVLLPDGATTPWGANTDSANNIVEAFDTWLGHGTPASDCLKFALEEVGQ